MKLTGNTSRWLALGALVAASSCALTDSRFRPVTSSHQSHLGITVEAPGVDGWQVHEQRAADKWFMLFKKTTPGDAKRTRFVSLEATRFTELERKVFDRDVGLKNFVEYRLEQGRAQTSARLRELESEIVDETVKNIGTVRGSIMWEERNNPHFPSAVLRLENTSYFFFHPVNPNVLIIVIASTRQPINSERLSPTPMAETFIADMRFY